MVETEEDLGTLYALELKIENCLKTANDLHIEKIQVAFNGYEYEFNLNQQVSVKDMDTRFKQIILLEKNAEFL